MNLLELLRRHERIALSFSGGKDSLAVVYLLRPFLDLMTVYHNDTGDLLPEVREVVDHVRGFAPHFVTVQGDVLKWQKEHGLPTDLLPHSAHVLGQAMGEHQTKLVSRYECCFANLMDPTYKRIKADGNTLVIRGTKAADMPRLPTVSGQELDGVEFFYPLQDWTNEQVFDYLREVGAPICRIYDHVTNSPECARCSAWWGEKRNSYLSKFHPALWADYRARLELVASEIAGPLANLKTELAKVEER